MKTADQLFPLAPSRRFWLAYASLACLLAWLCFGDLRHHLIETHDSEGFRDNARISQDWTLFFAVDKEMASGRLLAEFVSYLAFVVWGADPGWYHLLVVAWHLGVSLLLVRCCMATGCNFELSWVTGLLFLVNVAHFRGIHWISTLCYIMGLGFALLALLSFVQFSDTRRPAWLAGLYASLILGALSHVASLMAWPLCFFWAWTQDRDLRRALYDLLPFALLLAPTLAIIVRFTAKRTSTMDAFHSYSPSALVDLILGFARSLLWLLSRLLSTAHWLPLRSNERQTWELFLGAALLGLLVYLIRRKPDPIAAWSIWTVLLLVPFVLLTEQIILGLHMGPSRYLYFASAGSSLILAWGLQRASLLLGAWGRRVFACAILAILAISYETLKQAATLSIYSSARYYLANGDMKAGLERLHTTLAGDTAALPLAEVYFHLASTQLYEAEDPEPMLREALALFPDDLWLNLSKGLIDRESDDALIQQRGQEHLDASIERAKRQGQVRLLTTNLTALLHNMGKGYFRQENYPRAIRAYERALAIKPDRRNTRKALGEAYAYLGYEHFKQNRYDLATEAFQQTLTINPDDALAHISLGLLFYQQGRWREAANQHRAALKIQPDIHAQFGLGLASLAAGDTSAARTAYAEGIRQFGVEEARRIGAVNDLDIFIERNTETAFARHIRTTYWP